MERPIWTSRRDPRVGLVKSPYRFAVRHIALNDEPEDLDVESVAGYISTCLVADLWQKEPITVARAIVRVRRQQA